MAQIATIFDLYENNRTDENTNIWHSYKLCFRIPGKPLLFGTTDEFLRHFGFSSLEEMPTFGREELERFRSDAMLEAGVEEDDEADDETDYENDSETESETEEEIPV